MELAKMKNNKVFFQWNTVIQLSTYQDVGVSLSDIDHCFW